MGGGAGSPLNRCQSPVTRRIAATASVGCAPTPSQYCARSLSTSMKEGASLGWDLPAGAPPPPVRGTAAAGLEEGGLLLRVVLADRLDRAAVALGARVGDDDAVVRGAHLAPAHELDLGGHGGSDSPRTLSDGARRSDAWGYAGAEPGTRPAAVRGPRTAVFDRP